MSHETYTFGQYAGIVEDDDKKQLKFDFQEGMAGSILKPHPCNFGILCVFDRSSSDITIIF